MLNWTLEVIELVQGTKQIFSAAEFVHLMEAVIVSGYNPQKEVTHGTAQCLQAYLRGAARHAPSVLAGCRELACLRVSDGDTTVSRVYFDVLRLLPLDAVTRRVTCGLHEFGGDGKVSGAPKESYWEAYRQVRRGHVARCPSATFHSHNFSAIMSYVLNGAAPSMHVAWLERQFYSCQKLGEKDAVIGATPRDEMEHLVVLAGGNDRLLWFWAVWEAAQFCVLSKLRTPLGKPQETFTAIESTLKNYTADLALARDADDAASIRSHSSTGKNILIWLIVALGSRTTSLNLPTW